MKHACTGSYKETNNMLWANLKDSTGGTRVSCIRHLLAFSDMPLTADIHAVCKKACDSENPWGVGFKKFHSLWQATSCGLFLFVCMRECEGL